MDVSIREVQVQDKAQWRQLWDGYNAFYRSVVTEEITENTWQRMLSDQSSIFGRVAVVEGEVVGFALSVLHEGTWVTSPICYLEDLFVAENQRGRGIAGKLIQALIDEGKAKGWSRLYWHTATDNPARKLYDRFTPVEDYVRYRMNL
ncbi:GNAT family N-acetyltransferase [Scandinavium sp. NPDC088450]|uniref:GNAT family N-acetyltransferase n=1 Tax=Scandinavium sp. NPDC088450 TaxID=3364514 RepID=UPI00384FDC60